MKHNECRRRVNDGPASDPPADRPAPCPPCCDARIRRPDPTPTGSVGASLWCNGAPQPEPSDDSSDADTLLEPTPLAPTEPPQNGGA